MSFEKVGFDQGTEDNRMGFEGYGLGWAFFHKEVVAESTNFVLSGSVGFLRKERSKGKMQ